MWVYCWSNNLSVHKSITIILLYVIICIYYNCSQKNLYLFKGLWIWKKPQKAESADDTDVLIIDTEGFGGTDENITHDSRIFLFALLLSSYFIYNSVGNIDETALNNMSLIINLAKEIKYSTEGDNS